MRLMLLAALVGALGGSSQAHGAGLTAIALRVELPASATAAVPTALPAVGPHVLSPPSTHTPVPTPSLPAPVRPIARQLPAPSLPPVPSPRQPSGAARVVVHTAQALAPAPHPALTPSPATPGRLAGARSAASVTAGDPARGTPALRTLSIGAVGANTPRQAAPAGLGVTESLSWSARAKAASRLAQAPATLLSARPHTPAWALSSDGGQRTLPLGSSVPGARLAHARERHVATRGSSPIKELLGVRLSPETGQALMIVLIVLAATGLLALLFNHELALVLGRLTGRPRS
jgi:hypothetical protein